MGAKKLHEMGLIVSVKENKIERAGIIEGKIFIKLLIVKAVFNKKM